MTWITFRAALTRSHEARRQEGGEWLADEVVKILADDLPGWHPPLGPLHGNTHPPDGTEPGPAR